MSAIAVIPARGGSRRIPGKNIKLFHGKPIIAYSIDTALRSGLFDQIHVSSDDDEILTTAVKYGASVLLRSEGLGHDSVGTQEVVRDALQRIQWNVGCDYICCIYATAPLMTTEDLQLGFEMLTKKSSRYASDMPGPYVYTVGPNWQDAGQWYWGTYRAFVEGVSLDEGALYRLPPERTCDINTPEDWARAEQLYKDMHV